MKRVSVVGTVHEEKGAASVSLLLAILERIKPEVIFLEIPPAAFDDFLTGTRSNLESTAASRYRENYRVDLIPVDLPTPEDEFWSNTGALFSTIKRTSPEYRQLIDWDSRYVSEHGFAYLNSERCSELWSHIYGAIRTAIERLPDRSRLGDFYDSWIRTNERRDRAMMQNIENHCRQGSFNSAAFLVGAAHRRSIVNLSRSEPGSASSTIQWDFAGFLEESHPTVARDKDGL
jgi:hypothetical protein